MTSNVIAPGGIEGAEGLDRLSKKEENVQSARPIPAGRFGSSKDIADVTVYIFSDAENYVNREILVVDGGTWHMGNTGLGNSFEYPDFILGSEIVKGVKGTTTAKLWPSTKACSTLLLCHLVIITQFDLVSWMWNRLIICKERITG